MKNKKVIMITGSIVILLVLIAGVALGIYKVHENQKMENKEVVYELPAILPLSGEIYYLGESAKWAIDYAVDEINAAGGINGIPVHTTFYDSEFNKNRSKDIVEKVQAEYPIGTRVELVKMDDVQAPPVGTKGTVKGVDDTASLLVDWDNGCGLNVLFNVDKVRKLDTVKTVCYGKEEVWDCRAEAMAFFLEGMISSEGSECERYTKIYTELSMGKSVCTDEE